jgi:hypothetical protein
VRIRITRPWHLRDFPGDTLAAGTVCSVPTSVAACLFAMRCAEPAAAEPRSSCSTGAKHSGHVGDSRDPAGVEPSWCARFLSGRSIAEARLRIAGRWHRLRVELDASLMAQCSFYTEGPQR